MVLPSNVSNITSDIGIIYPKENMDTNIKYHTIANNVIWFGCECSAYKPETTPPGRNYEDNLHASARGSIEFGNYWVTLPLLSLLYTSPDRWLSHGLCRMRLSCSPVVSLLLNMPSHTAVPLADNQVNLSNATYPTESPLDKTTDTGSTTFPNAKENSSSHRTHDILTLFNNALIAKWMVAEVERAGSEQRIHTKAILEFPQFFRTRLSADYMRAKRLWQQRQTIIWESPGTGTRNGPIMHSVSAITKNGQRRMFTKVRKGRKRKTAEWARELQTDLVDEFNLLRKMGMKFSANTLKLACERHDSLFNKGSVPRPNDIRKRWRASCQPRYPILDPTFYGE